MRVELVLAWLSVAVLSGCSMGRFENSRTETQSLAPGNLEVIQVSTFNGGVEITGHDSAEVEVQIDYSARGDSEEEATANCEALSCEIVDEDGRLTVTAVRPTTDFSSSAKMTLKVPRFCRIEVETSNGQIEVFGINDDLHLSTSNGPIFVEEADGALKLSTSNGRIQMVGCTGAIDVKTSNGRVEFDGNLRGSDNRISTSNGSVQVQLAGDVLVDVTADTSNGSVSCSAEHSVVKQDDDFLRAIVGDGASDQSNAAAALSIDSSNGSIQISKSLPRAAKEGDESPDENE